MEVAKYVTPIAVSLVVGVVLVLTGDKDVGVPILVSLAAGGGAGAAAHQLLASRQRAAVVSSLSNVSGTLVTGTGTLKDPPDAGLLPLARASAPASAPEPAAPAAPPVAPPPPAGVEPAPGRIGEPPE